MYAWFYLEVCIFCQFKILNYYFRLSIIIIIIIIIIISIIIKNIIISLTSIMKKATCNILTQRSKLHECIPSFFHFFPFFWKSLIWSILSLWRVNYLNYKNELETKILSKKDKIIYILTTLKINRDSFYFFKSKFYRNLLKLNSPPGVMSD